MLFRLGSNIRGKTKKNKGKSRWADTLWRDMRRGDWDWGEAQGSCTAADVLFIKSLTGSLFYCPLKVKCMSPMDMQLSSWSVSIHYVKPHYLKLTSLSYHGNLLHFHDIPVVSYTDLTNHLFILLIFIFYSYISYMSFLLPLNTPDKPVTLSSLRTNIVPIFAIMFSSLVQWLVLYFRKKLWVYTRGILCASHSLEWNS